VTHPDAGTVGAAENLGADDPRGTRVLHVHCGDCAAAVARESGLPGSVLAWRDSSAVGPCAHDPDAHRRLRAQWWETSESEIQLARDLPDDRELVLWFGPDPWEQISLVEVLAGTRATALQLVPLDAGVGLMTPRDLPGRFADRRDARDLPARLDGLWRDLCADDRAALGRWVARLEGDALVPHLAPALARVLEDREGGRTERQIRSLVAAGVSDVAELMRRLRQLEDPRHGVWYGDVIVRRLRDKIATTPGG